MSESEFESVKVYTDIGIACGETAECGEEIISLLLPTETSHIDNEYQMVSMTLPCAKSLLIDLRDAIEVAVQHKQGE